MAAGLNTFNDLLEYVLGRGDEPVDATSDYDAEVRVAIVEKHRELVTLFPWLGLTVYPPQAFRTPAAITTLTLTVATAGAAVAGTLSAAPSGSISVANWWIIPDSKTYIMRITSHVADATAITIDVAPETLAAGSAVTLAQMEFALVSTTGLLVDGLWTDGGGAETEFVPVIAEDELKGLYPGRPSRSWPPARAARIDATRIRLSHYDTTAHRVEVPYLQEPTDPSGSTTLTLPSYLRPALANAALAALYEMKSDSRRALADARFDRAISRAKEYETLLRTGLGRESGANRNAPYGEPLYS